MNPLQGKVLWIAGLVILLNTLFPPMIENLGKRSVGRSWIGSDEKTVVVYHENKAMKQKREISVNMDRLILSEFLILGFALVLLGLGTDANDEP